MSSPSVAMNDFSDKREHDQSQEDDVPSSPSSSGHDSDSSSSSSTYSNPTRFDLDHQHPHLPPSVPAQLLHQFVLQRLKKEGFEAIENEPVLDELEGILWQFFESFLIHSHQLANHARRIKPNPKDLIESSILFGIGGANELKQEIQRCNQERTEGNPLDADSTSPAIRYKRPRQRSTSPHDSKEKHLLASDDEDEQQDSIQIDTFNSTPAAIASKIRTGKTIATQRTLWAIQQSVRRKAPTTTMTTSSEPSVDENAGGVFPQLPSKHSFRTTPSYPNPTLSKPFVPPTLTTHSTPQGLSSAALAHLATLKSRQNDSSQVASSLRNLIRRTSARPHSLVQQNAAVEPDQQHLLGTGEELDVVDYSTEWYASSISPLSTQAKALAALHATGSTTTNQSIKDGRVKNVWKLKPTPSLKTVSTAASTAASAGGVAATTLEAESTRSASSLISSEIDPSALEDHFLLLAQEAKRLGGNIAAATGNAGSGYLLTGGGVVKRRKWRV